jgi:flagellar biosynthesis anti-sigma factor FlgM
MRIPKTSGAVFPAPLDGDAPRPASAGAPHSEPHDSARISGIAREIAAARAHVDDAPDVRELRVRALKKSVQHGTYQADPDEIARKILDHGI